MNKHEYETLRRKLEDEHQANLAALARTYEVAKRFDAPKTPAIVKKAASPRKVARERKPATPSNAASFGRGDILQAVREAISHVGKRFTWMEVQAYLQAKHPGQEFKDSSIRQAVNRLSTLGTLTVASAGSGRKASTYQISET